MIRYAITDRALFGTDEATRRAGLLGQIAELARAGVDFVQLREKDLGAGELVELARDVRRELQRNVAGVVARTRLLVNARLDVALAARADGVHLTSTSEEIGAEQVREVYARAGLARPVVSASCHTIDDVRRLRGAGERGRPDLILFGPVFEKVVRVSGRGERDHAVSAKVGEGSGLALLARCCEEAAPISVLALGGVTPGNMQLCLDAGADGIAAIRLFAGSAAVLKELTEEAGPG